MGERLPRHAASEQDGPGSVEPLWRELTGDVLRRRRHERGEKLSDTAGRAGISVQYLSEIERGRKDPSSELLSAVTGALDLTLVDLTDAVAHQLRGPAARADRTAALGLGRDLGAVRSPLALAA